MFIFMGLILKLPVTAACLLIWYAVRAEPDPVEGEEATDDGREDGRFRRNPRPKRPRGPRRGPHAPDALPIPCAGEDGVRVTRRPAAAARASGAVRERG